MTVAETFYLWFGFGVGVALGIFAGWVFWRSGADPRPTNPSPIAPAPLYSRHQSLS